MPTKNDIELLKNFLSDKPLSSNENKLTSFEVADQIYPFTNEFLKDYYYKDLKDKKVLSVTSSGDHILHAVYAGATDITSFDINRFCKYYAALKIAMIKRFKWDDFFTKMEILSKIGPYSSEYYAYEFLKTLDMISNLLTKEELMFWQVFCNMHIENQIHVRSFAVFYEKTFNIYFDMDNYEVLKSKLNDISINYMDCGIDKISKKTNDTFDFMYVSNIFHYINKEEVAPLLISLRDILNKDGKICFPGPTNASTEFYLDENEISKYYNIEEFPESAFEESERIILSKL